MNINTTSNISNATSTQTSSSAKSATASGANFKDELSSISSTEDKKSTSKSKDSEKSSKTENVKAEPKDEVSKDVENDSSQNMDEALDGLQNIVEEVNKLGQKDENLKLEIKPKDNVTDNNDMINNDLNIQEPKEQLMQQMNSGMNFNSNEQPFTAYVQQNQNKLSSSQEDLNEESAILSTMAENIAMVNKNKVLQQNNDDKNQATTKTVSDSQGIKKVDAKTNVTVDTIVSYDSVIMNQDDVDFFANLVQNGELDMASIKNSEKSSQVSKTLADLLVKSMEDNKPVRIDFDNNISVIIKIGKNGKISADFLPSSQIAEAYLKENLPLLRQKFDDNNIDYEQLSQRKQQQDGKDRRKKDRDNE